MESAIIVNIIITIIKTISNHMEQKEMFFIR